MLQSLQPLIDAPKCVNWSRQIDSDSGSVRFERKRDHHIPVNECAFDFPKVAVTTKDRLTVTVDGIL